MLFSLFNGKSVAVMGSYLGSMTTDKFLYWSKPPFLDLENGGGFSFPYWYCKEKILQSIQPSLGLLGASPTPNHAGVCPGLPCCLLSPSLPSIRQSQAHCTLLSRSMDSSSYSSRGVGAGPPIIPSHLTTDTWKHLQYWIPLSWQSEHMERHSWTPGNRHPYLPAWACIWAPFKRRA